MKDINTRIQNYWTARSSFFNTIRKNELKDAITDRWLAEIGKYLPKGRQLNILDVGTGSGYFVIILSQQGHKVTGIDLTEAMLVEGRKNCEEYGIDAEFIQMDAQNLDFADGTFDVVITRNLTWTLPEPDRAYKEWCRVLKKGGILLNFDADYATNVRNHNQSASYIRPDEAYGHLGVTKELEEESAEITLLMPANGAIRPVWDLGLIKMAGFTEYGADETMGDRVLEEHNIDDCPMFNVWGIK